MLGDARLHLFRMEYDEEASELLFWYVGLAHDLQRPEGALDGEFCEYAEKYLRQARDAKGGEDEREDGEEGSGARQRGERGGRRRYKRAEAEEEEMEDMEEEEEEGEEGEGGEGEEEEEVEGETDSSPFLTRSKARSLQEGKVKMEKKETEESVPEQEEEGDESRTRVGRKRTKLSGEDDGMASKRAK